MELTPRSKKFISQLHPDLRRVVLRAATETKIPFIVICGWRTIDEQRLLVKTGKSRTMRSRHLRHGKDGLSRAVDLVPVDAKGVILWPPNPDKGKLWQKVWKPLAQTLMDAAKAEKVPIEWGGDWKGFVDGPHYQLPWASYP